MKPIYVILDDNELKDLKDNPLKHSYFDVFTTKRDAVSEARYTNACKWADKVKTYRITNVEVTVEEVV